MLCFDDNRCVNDCLEFSAKVRVGGPEISLLWVCRQITALSTNLTMQCDLGGIWEISCSGLAVECEKQYRLPQPRSEPLTVRVFY